MASRRSPALALAALAALHCATASVTFTASGYTANIYGGYYANGTTPLAQSFAAANAVLKGLPIRCALITLLQNNTWFPDNVTYGDGYAYLTGFSSNRLVPLLRAGDPNDPNSRAGPNGGRGFAVPATFADVDGSSVWMMKWIAQQSGANVTFDVVRLPWQIYYSSPLNNNTNDTAARVIYTLDELGYDCVCSAVFVYPARMQFFRYLLPHQSYGFQVVTTVPSWQPEGLFSRLFKFSRPFDWVLWLCMFLSIFVSGLVMTYYERNTGGDDFPLENESLKDKLMRGMFLSSMGVTLLAFFGPRTHEGRVYTSFKAFVIFVLMSSYIAQYSAIQNSLPVPVQPVTSIDSFETLGKPVCVRQIAAQQAWVAKNYPNLQVKPIPGLTQAGLLRAVANGQCVGAVGPDVELKFGLGGPGIFDSDGWDPLKTYCGLTTVGPLLNNGYYGIPLSKSDTSSINARTIEAMNVHVINAVESGAYLPSRDVYFPDADNRAACTSIANALDAEIARIKSGQLELKDMAGLFIVQIGGFLVSYMVHIGRLRGIKWRAQMRHASPAELEAMEKASLGDVKISVLQRPPDSSSEDSDEDFDDPGLVSHQPVAAVVYAHGGSEGRLAKLLMENRSEIDDLRKSLHHWTHSLASEFKGQLAAADGGGMSPEALRQMNPLGAAALRSHKSLSKTTRRIRGVPTVPLRMRPQVPRDSAAHHRRESNGDRSLNE